MDAATLRGYVEGYDRRKAAERAERARVAENALGRVSVLAQRCREAGARRVRLFGSLVTGRLGDTPDIDLAVEGVPPEEHFSLWVALSRLAEPVEVDLVDLASAPESLRRRVEAEGVDV
jgi:predicted nucleotidyltransferase